MKLGMINSAWDQSGKPLEQGLEWTKELGFDTVDIQLDPLDDDAAGQVIRIQAACARLKLPIVSVAGCSLGLCDFNKSVRDFHLKRSRAYVDMLSAFGGHNYLLVLGEYMWQQEVIPPKLQWQWGVEACKALGDYAGKQGKLIALELEPFQLSILNTIDAMAKFLDDVNHPAIQANIDISHMVLSKTPARALEALKGRAAHVHISDCDGKVHGDLPPGRGVVDFVPYLQAIGKTGVASDTISLELEYSPEPARIKEWVSEAYGATRKLMREAGV
ncbi:MAG: hypothetical protein AMXMBFR7_06820 [Planctomycetota bacterium]